MRIISDFHDYYDSVQAYGQDLSVIYLRKREELFKDFPFPECKAHTDRYRWFSKFGVKTLLVGFCWKVYPILEISKGIEQDESIAFCRNISDVDAYVGANFKKKEAKVYWQGRRQGRRRGRRWRRVDSIRQDIEDWFKECTEKQDVHRQWFLDTRCPVFVVEWARNLRSRDRCKITLNARLADFEFYRVVDTYTAFQEVSSFVAGLAVPLGEIPEISDLDMRDAKGFNGWSFRKEPTKRR